MADYDRVLECLPILIVGLIIAQRLLEEKKRLNAGIISETPSNSPEENFNHVIKCLPIYKAALKDDWETAKCPFIQEKLALNAGITYLSETTLHIAVGTNNSELFVEELVKLIMKKDPQMLRTSALHIAARVGNTKAARLLVDKDHEMAKIATPFGHTAFETLCYLLEVTEDVVEEDGTSPYRGENGADLLALAITADFYDVALYLVNQYPDLVMEKIKYFGSLETGLETLATKPNAFQSGSKLEFWRRIIYSWIPVNREKALEYPVVRPLEGIANQTRTHKANNGLNVIFWRVLQCIAPPIKKMHDCQVKHIQAEELVKHMCSTVISKGDHDIAWDVLGTAISTAVEHGIHELIEECIHQYPGIIWYEIDGFNLCHAAIKERQEKVYNLVYQMSGHKVFAVSDEGDENALHFAGKLAPPHRLNTVTGAALQMQRELQWFKEVEKVVEPVCKEELNNDRMTPRRVFTSEHKELLKEAQQWMKDTSSSATVVVGYHYYVEAVI